VCLWRIALAQQAAALKTTKSLESQQRRPTNCQASFRTGASNDVQRLTKTTILFRGALTVGLRQRGRHVDLIKAMCKL
jgi:hypothetical protein